MNACAKYVSAAALSTGMFLAAANAQADSVSATSEDGYGRILFTFATANPVHAAITGSVLTISFDRATDADANAIQQSLSAVVSSARADADHKTFRIALSQPLTLHTSKSGEKFAIDLVPQNYNGTPPDLPPPPPPPPRAVDVSKLDALNIRAGAYPTFTRLVFDWQTNVPYTVFAGAGKLTIRFEALARPDFAALTHVAPPWVKQAGWHAEGKATTIEFDTDAASGYHDFRDGNHIVLDILAPKTDAAAYNPPSRQGLKPKPTKLADAANAPPAANNPQAQAVADAAAALKGPVADNDAAKPAANSGTTTKKPATASGPPKALPGAAPAPAQPQTQAAAAPAATPPPPAPPPATATPTQAADARATKNGATLLLANAGGKSAAVFVRGTTAWIVIDAAQPFDPAKLKAQLGDFAQSIDASSSAGASVLRITLKQGEQIAAIAQGADLKVTIAPRIAPLPMAIAFARDDEEPSSAKLTTLLPGANHVLQLTDPVAGDVLTIIPALTGRGTIQPHSFIEFAELPSASGLVLMALSDDLNVGANDSRVAITRPGGLKLTPPIAPTAASPAALAREGEGPSFLDLAAWSKAAGGTFVTAERKLRANAAALKPEEANAARLTLARFYLGNNFAAETLGQIDLMQAADPGLQSDAQLLTMRAAADYMMGRYRDAHNDISSATFDNDRHAVFWRGLTEAALENWDGARTAFAMAEPVVRRYPADWQARVRVAQAQTALAKHNMELADAALARLPRDLPKPIMLDAQLARGKLYAEEGRYRDAAPLFDAVEHSGDDRAAAQAIYARVDSGLAAGAMSGSDAIAALDKLRYRWRGDALELKTLRKLGALYFAQSRWREGFDTLRAASQNYPNEDLARQAQDDMRTAFEGLFLNGKAAKMPPIEALGLFYDYIDLTPIGPNGDEMIRRMTDRLVGVDLLGPAAGLLNYQVTKRLDGVARSQVAARLAMIYLMDHKPKDALATIESTRIAGLPETVNHQRMLLEARALAALKQWDTALDMIAVDDAPDSRRLRADIYWESGNWAVAAQKTEELLAQRWSDASALTDDERHEALRAAIAYSLAGDETSLNRLRDHFGAKMKTSPDASSFAILTQDIDAHGVAFRDTAGRVASIDTFEAFIKDFRRHYEVAAATN